MDTKWSNVKILEMYLHDSYKFKSYRSVHIDHETEPHSINSLQWADGSRRQERQNKEKKSPLGVLISWLVTRIKKLVLKWNKLDSTLIAQSTSLQCMDSLITCLHLDIKPDVLQQTSILLPTHKSMMHVQKAYGVLGVGHHLSSISFEWLLFELEPPAHLFL